MASGSDQARRLAAVAGDDDYFPSFLTAAPSAPKADKADKALDASRAKRFEADAFAQRPRARLTFAESLAMDEKRSLPSLEDSPFAFNGADALDRMYVRKRKPFDPSEPIPSALVNREVDEDDAPPPPTSTLLDPTGFLGGSVAADAEEKTSVFPSWPVSAATASYASSGFFASVGDSEWGSDRQYWITVFGFPVSARAFILSHFQTVGEVINFSAGAGNWLHVRYCTRLQAEKALSFDGQTLANGSVMIGVKKCYPAELDGVTEEPSSNLFTSLSRRNHGSRDLEVDPTDDDIMLPPRRRQDICSRLLSYLFNW